MAFTRYHNISGSTAVTNRLIQRGSNANNIQSILITNTHGTNASTITLFLQDSTGTIVKNFNILSTINLPADTALLLDDKPLLSFDNNVYDLFITVGSSDTVDVLINR
tara:strand:- start:691 stop:1014 length:324 start_codon:yes stop_codon:yes gene_type:complete